MKVDQFTAELLVKEYPWLGPLDDDEEEDLRRVGEVRIGPITEEVLDNTLAPDERGSIIIGQVHPTGYWGHVRGSDLSSGEDTIGAQLRRLNEHPDYIVIWTSKELRIYRNGASVQAEYERSRLERAYKVLAQEERGGKG